MGVDVVPAGLGIGPVEEGFAVFGAKGSHLALEGGSLGSACGLSAVHLRAHFFESLQIHQVFRREGFAEWRLVSRLEAETAEKRLPLRSRFSEL